MEAFGNWYHPEVREVVLDVLFLGFLRFIPVIAGGDMLPSFNFCFVIIASEIS